MADDNNVVRIGSKMTDAQKAQAGAAWVRGKLTAQDLEIEHLQGWIVAVEQQVRHLLDVEQRRLAREVEANGGRLPEESAE